MRLQIPDDCCATARRLLVAGACTPDEMLEFYRGEVLCLRGKAKVFAERCVVERDRGMIRHEPWTPLEDRRLPPRIDRP